MPKGTYTAIESHTLKPHRSCHGKDCGRAPWVHMCEEPSNEIYVRLWMYVFHIRCVKAHMCTYHVYGDT